MASPRISIIVPVFNEGENITEMITGLEKTVQHHHDVFIIYDFDQDNSVSPAKRLARRFSNVHVVKNQFGGGVFQAVKTGFVHAKGDIVVVMPADLADDPHVINDMHEKLQEGYDIVCATRYALGGRRLGGGVIKPWLSRFAGTFTPFLLGIPTTDLTNGFKMYRRRVLEDIRIESGEGWVFSMELVIKAHHRGFAITDVPSVWKDRTRGQSKFKFWKWLPRYLHWYFYGVIRNLF